MHTNTVQYENCLKIFPSPVARSIVQKNWKCIKSIVSYRCYLCTFYSPFRKAADITDKTKINVLPILDRVWCEFWTEFKISWRSNTTLYGQRIIVIIIISVERFTIFKKNLAFKETPKQDFRTCLKIRFKQMKHIVQNYARHKNEKRVVSYKA